jgi:single-strand DNA-binding protein
MDVNKIILVGTLEKDPNIGTTTNGKTVANLILVTNESYKNVEGKEVEKFERHKIVAWGKQAEICKTLKKDEKIYVEGKNQTRRTDSSVITEIVATLVTK